jgi:hypothetical protein
MRSDHSHGEPLLGFGDAWVLNAFAHSERVRERSQSEGGLVVGVVRLAPDLGGVGFASGVLPVLVRSKVKSLASGLDRFPWISPRQMDPC